MYGKKIESAIIEASNEGLYEKGKCYYDFGYYMEAAECFIKCFLTTNRTNSYLYIDIANSFYKGSQYDVSLKYITMAIEDNDNIMDFDKSKYIESLNLKGKNYRKKKEFKKSINNFEQVYYLIKFKEEDINYTISLEDVVYQLMLVYADFYLFRFENEKNKLSTVFTVNNLDQYDETIKYLKKSTCITAYMQKDYFKRFSNELISLNKNKEKDINKIECEIEIHEKECFILKNKIIEDISSRALNWSPNNEEINFELAWSQNFLEKYDDALKTYEKLIKLNPKEPKYLNNVAIIYQKKNQLDIYINKSIKIIGNYNEKIRIYDNFIAIIDQILKTKIDNKEIKKLEKKAKTIADLLMKEIFLLDSKSIILKDYKVQSIKSLKLYKFKGFNANIMDSILNNYLYFSTRDELNDPLDLPFLNSMETHLEKYLELKKNGDIIKIFCASLECSNTLMWSHYGDEHKGICIEYEIKSLPKNVGWNKINYVHKNFTHERIEKNYGVTIAGLYTKDKNWSYEKEIRLVSYKEKDNKLSLSGLSSKHDTKVIEGCISNIIIGYKFPKNQIVLLKTILEKVNQKRKDLPKIEIYQMKLDKDKPFNLLKEKLK